MIVLAVPPVLSHFTWHKLLDALLPVRVRQFAANQEGDLEIMRCCWAIMNMNDRRLKHSG